MAKAQHDAGNINDSSYLNQQVQVASARLALTGRAKAEDRDARKTESLDGTMG